MYTYIFIMYCIPTWGIRGARNKIRYYITYYAWIWNILEPINGISLNILGNLIFYFIWASPRNMHIRIPHVGLYIYSSVAVAAVYLSLYKMFVYFEAVASESESTILWFPPPTCIAHPGGIPLHDSWTVYDSPSDLPCVCYIPYNTGNNNIV